MQIFRKKLKIDVEKIDWGKKYAMERLVVFNVSVLHSDDVRRESEKSRYLKKLTIHIRNKNEYELV